MQQKVGLIAGRDNLPFEVVQQFNFYNLDSVVIGLAGEVAPELAGLCKRYIEIAPGHLGTMIKVLQEAEVTELVFAGKVGKQAIFGGGFDAVFQNLLARLSQKNDDAILLAIVEEFEKNGIKVARQTDYLKRLLAGQVGPILGEVTPGELADLRLGFRMAKASGGLDIGQSVVVKQGVVLAVEAIEGTDQAIIRGGTLGGPGAVVVKVSKPEQDERFDVPTIGRSTLESMIQVGATVLGIEAEKTLITQQDELLELARIHGIKIFAIAD